ncbi:10061_t:CDS:2 [Gigaspora margarita]|uniref:10061_t:CDS:1 n=1 Tax=Gigaspora margarita TaxID=4874 RepID=A0ABN7VD30_GIGMA|nr:10061_t:CDS:2 [Gigaspora margarita]
MSKSDPNFKNHSQICEAIYEHIKSCDDEQYKLELKKLSEMIKFLRHIADKCTNSEEVQICDLKDLLIPSVDSTLLKHEEIYFDNRPELNKEEKKNYNISHPKIILELAENLGIWMLSTIFLKCEIKFEVSKQFVPSINKITKIINGMLFDLLFKEFLKNTNNAGAQRFSIYLDKRILDKNSEKSTLLSKEMHNWQGPAVWIYYNKSFEKKDFSDHKNKIGRTGIISSYYLTNILSFVSENNAMFLDSHAWFLPLQDKFKDQYEPYFAIEDCDFKKEFNSTLFRLLLRNKKGKKQLIFEMEIQNLNDKNIRKKVEYIPQAYGGIATILAQSDKEDDFLNKILIDSPILDGRAYTYILCEHPINLEVYINSNFYWSIDRKDILQSNNNETYKKWNQYILFEVLSPSHIKLLNEITKINDELIEIFINEHLPELRIKKLDTQGILDLLAKELPNEQEMD